MMQPGRSLCVFGKGIQILHEIFFISNKHKMITFLNAATGPKVERIMNNEETNRFGLVSSFLGVIASVSPCP